MEKPVSLPLSQKVLYVVSIAPNEGFDQKFNEWYDTEHVPELLACPGFEGAKRYSALEALEGSPHYLALYEMSGMDAFQSPEYLALRARTLDDRTPLAREVMENRHLNINAKYQEILNVRPAQA
jgi:hypothetical protein